MNIETINKTDYQEVTLAFQRRGVVYYYCNLILNEDGDAYRVLREIYDHVPTQEDKEQLHAKYLSMCKKVKLAEIDRYDKSMDVNGTATARRRSIKQPSMR